MTVLFNYEGQIKKINTYQSLWNKLHKVINYGMFNNPNVHSVSLTVNYKVLRTSILKIRQTFYILHPKVMLDVIYYRRKIK